MALIAGIDEVGRGALAGPVVVGAVFFSDDEVAALRADLGAVLRRSVADSKKLTRLQRERAATFLRERVAWGIGLTEAPDVDALGLTAALTAASGQALNMSPQPVDAIRADAGLNHPHIHIPTEHFVKGDERILQITCASIIAKVYRDHLMQKRALRYPEYGWEQNVGYGSAAHRASIRTHGPTPEHRRSFIGNIATWK